MITRHNIKNDLTNSDKNNNIKFDFKIALAGNPNVGKSTIFNQLTGMKQHTGNWTGKTVEYAKGFAKIHEKKYCVVDLPGTYSMLSFSPEEEITKNFLQKNDLDCVVIVMDANILERNLSFALQVLSIIKNAVLCINLCDEAKKNGIVIDEDELSLNLGIPVVSTTATNKKDIEKLKLVISNICNQKTKCFRVKRLYENIDIFNVENHEKNTELLSQRAKKIFNSCVIKEKENLNQTSKQLDKLFTSKITGIPVMLILLGLIFWITAVGANYPSIWLSKGFDFLKIYLIKLFDFFNSPACIKGFFIDGIYTTLCFVVSVMLPPMAIFFPLFALIEDSGYLPRFAFNLDSIFEKCGANGKQGLTMAMGIGCNACGVTGCRIIESPKERIIATVTNNFMPCNGRFPALIALITIFFAKTFYNISGSVITAIIMLLLIIFSVFITLLVSKILSNTILKGEASSFALELPPYRKPKIIKTILRSLLDRALFVLGRAIVVAIPAGGIIWLLANIKANNISILQYCTNFFEPFGRAIGLDGVIVMAFILGFPANETVIPVMVMAYMSTGTLTDFSSYTELQNLLISNGWTPITAICTIIMCLCHFPCSTTCLTIKKETNSIKWTIFSIIMPTLVGIFFCFLISNISHIFI